MLELLRARLFSRRDAKFATGSGRSSAAASDKGRPVGTLHFQKKMKALNAAAGAYDPKNSWISNDAAFVHRGSTRGRDSF